MSPSVQRLLSLRPRSGRRLPRRLRATHVHRIAERLPEGVLGAGFVDLLEEIDTGPVHRGNRVEVYCDGARAFAAMRRAIEGAERELLVESYILRDDSTGRELCDALAAAAGRGVAVKLLADALGSAETREEFWGGLRRRGVEVRLFHPLLPYFWNHLVRDHRKILVADRRVGFTGGMNIGDEYGSSVGVRLGSRGGSGGGLGGSGAGGGTEEAAAGGAEDDDGTGRGWRDTHVRVEGPVVDELALVFSEGWRRAGGADLEVAPVDRGEARGVGGGAGILVLDSRPRRGHRESAAVLAAIVAAARRTVWLTNAYFAPKRAAIDLLGRAASRGVDVRLLLPGLTDVPLVRHAGHGYFAALLRRGVRIYEYRAAILHAKTLVADDTVSVVGSSNLDFRSFRFNAECNLVIVDPETGGELAAEFRRDLERAEEIDAASWRRRRLRHKAGDRMARWLSPLL